MQSIPESITKLLEERDTYKKQANYQKADEIRQQIQDMGYVISDTKSGTKITPSTNLPKKNFLAIFGSGETSSIGRKIHEYIFTNIGKKEISIVILTTPAGFQPNVMTVHQEIADFFKEHLTNFHPKITIVYTNTSKQANDQALLQPIQTADYIFMGPGSPTYAVKQLKNSLLIKLIAKRLAGGASLCLSSAAAIAFSQKCLPVYEIYKVGEDLHWVDGLDMYQTLLQKDLTIIPHFNNTEGGDKTDTSCAYIGKKRFTTMLSLYTDTKPILGIDEHTALVINLIDKTQTVLGSGKLHNIR